MIMFGSLIYAVWTLYVRYIVRIHRYMYIKNKGGAKLGSCSVYCDCSQLGQDERQGPGEGFEQVRLQMWNSGFAWRFRDRKRIKGQCAANKAGKRLANMMMILGC